MSKKKDDLDTQTQVLEIGSRIKKPPSDAMVNIVFARELGQQAHLFEAMGLVDIAYTLTGIKTGLIPHKEGAELLSQLIKLQKRPTNFVLEPSRGDLYTNREAWLSEQTTSVGWLGPGRARREVTTTAFLIVLRNLILKLTGSTIELGKMITQLTNLYKKSIMPDYTYLQAAQPTTFGHYLLSFAYPLVRDLERMEQLFHRVNKSPMGCGSTNGSILTNDREYMALLLGFSGIATHARDAMWQFDVMIELSAVLSSSITNLSRLSEDLQIYCTQEFDLVELDDTHARASKIMPQKKNPFALTYIRSIANELIGSLASISATARTPTGQPDNRLSIYSQLPDAIRLVNDCMQLMTEVLEHLHFNHKRGKQLVLSGWSLSTDLAESLAQEYGLDFRAAHKLVGYLAEKYNDEGILSLDAQKVHKASIEVFGVPINITDDFLKQVLNPDNSIQSKKARGSASIKSINNMINECNQIFSDTHKKNMKQQEYFVEIEISLIEQVK
ncbi:argininosuccinate lyase [uncultured Paraglaciecola sp.]|uniref:argininosuccinate lyase n=1 Tax=uncultured Paraglaciecola sp. TaxID=1765024 RepID=UPI0025FD94CB|nr:argininosuccinate lyase [uncultured Paraglaciecola sp.]